MSDFIGPETARAILNWGEGNTPYCLIKAYAEVKKAALTAANEVSSIFPPEVFTILIKVLDEIIAGEHNNLFKLPLKQGGAGTSLNMNLNEVITHLVNSRCEVFKVDSLEHINKFQSTNDTFNTAVTIIFLRHLEGVEKMVIELQEILVEKERSFSNILVTGRTEMISALPMTFGQVFSSYAGSIERDRWRFNKIKERVRPSVLGGTAIGTCFSAPSKYLFSAEKQLRSITGLSLPRSQNLISDISMCDKFVEAGSVYDALSNTLFKMASDFTIYISKGEMIHPELQYGSSIMPMKTNPVLLEFIKGLSIDISLESRKISEYSRNGQLQLNAFLPFILDSEITIYNSITKALDGLIMFISNLKLDENIIKKNLYSSGAIVNSLRPYCEYSKLKELSQIITNESPRTIDEIIEILINNSDLKRDFLEEYLKPGGFTSFLKITKEGL